MLYECSKCHQLFIRQGTDTRCADCGQPYKGGRSHGFPPQVRKAILERDHHRCVLCGSTENLEADHITPWSKGGADTLANGRTLCRTCHRRHTGTTFGWGSR